MGSFLSIYKLEEVNFKSQPILKNEDYYNGKRFFKTPALKKKTLWGIYYEKDENRYEIL